MFKVYDCRYEHDSLEVTPYAKTIKVHTKSGMADIESYSVDITYEDAKVLRDYLTSLLEGRETND